ncbi:MAG: AraC family transcriptional regulator [Bacteroidales bacterium]
MVINEDKFKINKVLDRINEKINSEDDSNELSLAELSEIAGFSERQFSRVFPRYLSDSFNKYYSTLRLEYAAHLLKTTNLSVLAISEKVGYSNAPAINKEFKKRFETSPLHFRATHQLQPFETGFREFENVQLPAIHLIYNSSITNYNQCVSVDFEQQNWNELELEAQRLGVALENPSYWGICFDDSNVRFAEACRFYACVEVTKTLKNQDKINSLTVPAGKYAKFTHKGSYDLLESLYEDVYRQALFSNQLTLRSGLVLEKYLNSVANTSEADLLTEVYFPIK